MKTGLRKLCDVPCGPATLPARFADMCQRVEEHLLAQGIGFQINRGWDKKLNREFRRYCVSARDVRRATDGLPLELRGFKSSITKWAGE